MKCLILISFLICITAGIPWAQSHPNITIPPSTSDIPVTTNEQLSSSTVKAPLTFEASTSEPSVTNEYSIKNLFSVFPSIQEYATVKFGIEETLAQTITRTLYDYRSKINQWTNCKIELSDEYFFKTDLALNYNNYLVTFVGIFITQVDEPSPPPSSQIHCIFSDLLQVTIPIQEDKLQFRGLVKILNKEDSSFIENFFNITFNNLRVVLTSRTNHTAYQKLLNNQTQFEILYDNSEIGVRSLPKYESITTMALSDLILEIRSYCEAKITHQLSTFLSQNVSFSDLSANCMKPLRLISTIPSNIASKHRLYFNTQEKFIILRNYSITLTLEEAKIDGILNITDIRLIEKNNSIAFAFLIKNLNGSSSWGYYDDDADIDLQTSMPFNFTIDSVTIKGTFYNEQITNVHLDFESFNITSESKGFVALLGNRILQPELKKIITKQVNGALQTAITREQLTQVNKLLATASKALKESGKDLDMAREALRKEDQIQIILKKSIFQ